MARSQYDNAERTSLLPSNGSIQETGRSRREGGHWGSQSSTYGATRHDYYVNDDVIPEVTRTQEQLQSPPDPEKERVSCCGCQPYFRWLYVLPVTLFLDLFCIGVMYSISEYTNYIYQLKHGAHGWSMAVSTGLAIQAGLTGIVAVFVGAQLNVTPPRVYMVLGVILMGTGQVLMGLAVHKYPDPTIYYTGAVVTGIGNGMLVITSLQHLLAWFTKHAAVISGVNGMFIGFGAMINSLIIPKAAQINLHVHQHDQQLNAYGVLYSYGLLYVLLFAPLMFFARFPAKPEPSYDARDVPERSLSRFEILKTHQFWLYLCGLFASLFCGWSLEPQMVNLFNNLHGVAMTGNGTSQSSDVRDYENYVSIINFFYSLGRVLAGWLASRYGTKRTYMVILSTQAVCFAIILCILDKAPFRLIYGFLCLIFIAFGGAKVLIAPTSREFFGLKNLNVAVGMNFTGASLASLLGPFVSDAARQWSVWYAGSGDVIHHFDYVFMICAVINILGLVSIMFLRPLREIDSDEDLTQSIIVVAEQEDC